MIKLTEKGQQLFNATRPYSIAEIEGVQTVAFEVIRDNKTFYDLSGHNHPEYILQGMFEKGLVKEVADEAKKEANNAIKNL